MSKHGPCYMRVNSCGPVAAWITTNPAANTVRLCQRHLDWWFDNADDGSGNEPLNWGWLIRPEPAAADIAAWVRDSRNHQAVAGVLRREARIGAPWLHEFIARENRIHRRPRV
ncbi:hypothetical protein ACWCQW_03085 [Streptomyces mirabilis]